jgi:hypothetical protein
MAKPSSDSSWKTIVARVVKVAMVVVLVPLVLGLLLGILDQLDLTSVAGGTFREWVAWGFATYVGIHVLLYRPAALFQASRRVFSVLAVWLFGGQVTTVEAGGGGKGSKGGKGEAAAQGSTLVAFSPYVIPLPSILVAATGWVLQHWMARVFLDGPVSFLLGLTIAFHWLMTADELQQQRSRWHVETYLLAIGLVFVLTLLIGGACLPWAIPEFSFLRALADGLAYAQQTYTTIIQRLFF